MNPSGLPQVFNNTHETIPVPYVSNRGVTEANADIYDVGIWACPGVTIRHRLRMVCVGIGLIVAYDHTINITEQCASGYMSNVVSPWVRATPQGPCVRNYHCCNVQNEVIAKTCIIRVWLDQTGNHRVRFVKMTARGFEQKIQLIAPNVLS